MSKLLNLQEWTTCDDAARYLTQRMKERVSKADVLRLALIRTPQALGISSEAYLGTARKFYRCLGCVEHFPPDGYTWVEEGDDWYDHDHNIRARRQNLQ